MRIALVSYEYPPDTADGGVATYIYQLARLLLGRGHGVEVFTAGSENAGTEIEPGGVQVHRVVVEKRGDFGPLIAEVFLKRHQIQPFDVMEGVDRFAHCRQILQLIPTLPFVLKLHTPGIVLKEINTMCDYRVPGLSLSERLAIMLKKARRKWNPYWRWMPTFIRMNILTDSERLHALEADEIIALCGDMADLIARLWLIDRSKIQVIPLPFSASPDLLAIQPNSESQTITYIGRLEYRKGVLDLARAIPLVLKQIPSARFRLVGRAMKSPDQEKDMQQYLKDWLEPYGDAVEFAGAVPPSKVPELLKQADVCVVPSIWENFPYVVLESMAAARAVVATNTGGMKDIINSPEVGSLVPPQSPEDLAQAVVALLEHPAERARIGAAARARILATYDGTKIMPAIELSYQKAIERRRQLGPR
ncbi:MAG: glycosyltransferase family 1 protein [Candidatus Melainabacteria bacterium]|nr:MAG: glycosyltransferase family 1 protein [Candidatus Melainabacteria bacterium]